MVPVALGTQTGGSVIRPASFCGVVGYKPSFGLVSRHGVKPLAESLDTVGIFARSVQEAALLTAVMARRPELMYPAPRPTPRIGVWRTFEWHEASRDTVAAIEDAARLAAAAGADVREAHMPPELSSVDKAHHAIERFEIVDSLAYEMHRHRNRLSQRLRERLEEGERVAVDDYDQAQCIAQACRELMRGVFNEFDVLLAPSAVGEAPKGLEGTGNAVFNRGWTLLGLPCISVPGFRGSQGLPVGVQLIGAFREDTRLLTSARWMEQALLQA
jgi:Asp-tRNA(Asn)/Glu-tRNA(Gln) amidotransferase A subunit family amidase